LRNFKLLQNQVQETLPFYPVYAFPALLRNYLRKSGAKYSQTNTKGF